MQGIQHQRESLSELQAKMAMAPGGGRPEAVPPGGKEKEMKLLQLTLSERRQGGYQTEVISESNLARNQFSSLLPAITHCQEQLTELACRKIQIRDAAPKE